MQMQIHWERLMNNTKAGKIFANFGIVFFVRGTTIAIESPLKNNRLAYVKRCISLAAYPLLFSVQKMIE